MPRRGLIVDESEDTRKEVKAVLLQNGYQVAGEAAGGYEAVAYYKVLLPDFVLMNFNLPTISGLKAASEILSYDKNAKIILWSDNFQSDNIASAMRTGVKDLIIKPFTNDDLLEKIKKIFQ